MTDTLKILIIEDDESDYKLLIRHLRAEGLVFEAFRVDRANKLKQALRSKDWQLVITDYTLPDIDVRKKLHWILGKLPNVPVIMVSGTLGEELAVDLLKAGLEDFVRKQDLSRLIPAIQRGLASVRMRAVKEKTAADLELRNRALSAASNGVVISRADGDMPVVYVNAAFECMTGYSADEVLGRNCRFLQGDDRDQKGVAKIHAGLAAARACQATVKNYRKDGTCFWNRLSIAPVADDHGTVTHFVGIQEDITESRRNENKLRQSAAVFESTQEGMVITDLDGNILEINQAFSEITGYARDEALGKNTRMLKSGRHGSEFYQAMWASITQFGQWRGEIWNRRKDGDVYPEWLNINNVIDTDGRVVNYIGVFSDITRMKRSEEQLEYLAHHDPLTGLPNRLLFNARLDHALKHAERNGTLLAILCVDLDRFKNINDTLGHPSGDVLLKEAGERLSQCVRSDDTVARIGGDEFTLLLEDIHDPADAAMVAEKLLLGFTEPFELHGRDQFITASIGISTYPRDGKDETTLIRNADAAMYQVKDRGRHGYAFYTEQLTSQSRKRLMLENDLHKAVEKGELRLHYQPQMNLLTGALIGVEALVRWEHPEQGMISPASFIPIAEESGLILNIGEWVLYTACSQARAWLDGELDFGRMSVNIAGAQIKRGRLLEVTKKALQSAALAPERLELEVTEGFIMGQAKQAVAVLEDLRNLGVTLAIDDFGTGYSSLTYLKRLPISRLKIDQSFVRDIPDDLEDVAITRAVIALGTSLGLEVIAEGVETPDQQAFLLSERCALGQGYLFSRPVAAEEFVLWAQDRRS